MRAMFSSTSDEWETPQDLFNKLNAEFHFNLDACASENNHKCEKYYTKEQNGLLALWKGNVWCNPPYGRTVGEWVKNACVSARHNKGVIVMLLPVRTDTKWFHKYIYNQPNVEIRFIKGRLKFGNSKNSAPFPSMIAIFR